MVKITSVEMDHWRRYGGFIMAVAFSVTTWFFKRVFRWNMEPSYI
jgi:hypothetical protein